MESISKAIFLDEKHLDETNTYLFFITLEEGKVIKLIAKGLNKPTSKNRVNLNAPSVVELEYFPNRNSNGGKLKKVIQIQKSIVNTKSKFIFWNLINSILLEKEEWDQNVLSILLNLINWNDFEYSFEIIMFLLKQILHNENYHPIIDQCARCNSRENIISFDLKENGLICLKCFQEENYFVKLSENFLQKIITFFSEENLEKIINIKFNFNNFEREFLIEQFINFFNDIIGINIYNIKKITFL